MKKLASPFKSKKGETAYLAAYEAMMKYWRVPYEIVDLPGYYGVTHLVVSGPKEAPALVLLHGGRASLTMWSPNIADLSRVYRVYAIDIMGQPSRSIPDNTFKRRADLIPWFSELLDALKIQPAHLVGQSYGGWFSLYYALQKPERVKKIVLLSPAASFLPLNRQHSLRGAFMFFFPSRYTVGKFKLWETYRDSLADPEHQAFYNAKVEQMYLGFKYFRCQGEATPDIFPDEQLRSLQIPALLLIGEQEVIYDPVASLERARRLIPNLEADLIPHASHDMSYVQVGVVDARILKFLQE